MRICHFDLDAFPGNKRSEESRRSICSLYSGPRAFNSYRHGGLRMAFDKNSGIHIRTKKAGAQMAKTGQNNMYTHCIAEHYIFYAACSLDSVFMLENIAWRPRVGAIPRRAELPGDIAVFPESDVQLSVRVHIYRNSLWGGFFKRGLYYDAPEGKIIMSKRFLAI